MSRDNYNLVYKRASTQQWQIAQSFAGGKFKPWKTNKVTITFRTGCSRVAYSILFSDAHCPLDISININTTTCTCNACNPRTDIQPKKEQIKKWNLAKADEFNEYLDLAKIETIDNALDLLTDDHVNLNNINDTVKNIGDIFVDAAKHTFGTYNPKNLIKEPTMRKKRNRINHGLTTSAGKKEKTRGALKGYTDYVNPKKIKELKIKAKKNIKRP
ncbi:unnamed protein product [Mytilus edulis]|uniref:Uncharacterized protein n=1 Tax=Mytilus edulis TaxID=6550 RepID=A0A8S3SGR9_MYTED|nr:unnamed protein product [Mytilus edulis]